MNNHVRRTGNLTQSWHISVNESFVTWRKVNFKARQWHFYLQKRGQTLHSELGTHSFFARFTFICLKSLTRWSSNLLVQSPTRIISSLLVQLPTRIVTCRSNGYQLTTMRSRDDYIQLQLGNATQSLIVTRIRLLPSQEYPEAIEPFSWYAPCHPTGTVHFDLRRGLWVERDQHCS